MLKSSQAGKWFWFLFSLQIVCFGINIVSSVLLWHRHGTPFHIFVSIIWIGWGYLLYGQVQQRRKLRLAQIELALDGMMNSTLPSYTFSTQTFRAGSPITVQIPGGATVTLQSGASLIVNVDSQGNVITKVVP